MKPLELLTIQAEGSFDDRGRIVGWYGVTIACAEDDQALWIGVDVPEEVAVELAARFDPGAASLDPAQPPPALGLCRRLLENGRGVLPCTAGPSFAIDGVLPIRSKLDIVCSDGSTGDRLRSANPGNWHPVEWDELLDGRLGPWAMAVEDDLVVSICHTPVPVTARGAECGVWTRPGYRGRGFGAAVVAAWAAVLRPAGRHLFYSTDAENFRSQRLARRLQLRPLGWTWRLGHTTREAAGPEHPLCTLRR